jgi:3'(2'), 5'-bisphosphate nucleotidase
MEKKHLERYLELAINASLAAADEIMKIYASDFSVEHKNDNSPVTLADKNAHHAIAAILAEAKIPMLSEEGIEIPFNERKNWDLLWIVDPLDGTKEFVKRNGEFTVNIALVQNQKPIVGVIYQPITKVFYFAAKEMGSYKYELKNKTAVSDIIKSATQLPLNISLNKHTIVASRSHMNSETMLFVSEAKKKHAEIDFVSAGSSLKFCLVAEGAAHVYPRFAPTMEWDTAAGQIIAKEAGKKVIDCSTDKEMIYNREFILNSWFIVE